MKTIDITRTTSMGLILIFMDKPCLLSTLRITLFNFT